MKKLAVDEFKDENMFCLVEPTSFLEIDFEAEVVKVLTHFHPAYWCGVFAGTFVLEGERRSADLALIHKSLSHWFVIEVELAGHSLEHHILPQVRCFRYGEPDDSCITSLIHGFSTISREQAGVLLSYVPRYVAVVANMPNAKWASALRGLDVQYLTVSIFQTRHGRIAHGIEGQLVVRRESLGFALYSEVHRSLRIHKGCGLSVGQVQILDQFGNQTLWMVREEAGTLWISKNRGPTLLEHNSYVQIFRTSDGQISLKPSLT